MTYTGKICPSAECKEGSRLLGIVNKDGLISFTNSDIEIDNEFIQIASRGRSPTKRFRFSNLCIESQCTHWKEHKCNLIDNAISIIPSKTQSLPKCNIRKDCRWFHQHGESACKVCPGIITDLNSEDTGDN